MTTTAAIRALVGQYPGRFSAELGINVSAGRSREIFKWFLASVLFGARISENIVKQTFRQFASRNVVAPGAILNTGWDGLVEILDQGGYVRYDFKTAAKLLDICGTLKENYQADLANLHAAATDPKDLEQRLKSLAKGIGDVTVNIFLREMRGIWDKADPLPSDLAVMAAKDKGIIPGGVKDRRTALALLKEAWDTRGSGTRIFRTSRRRWYGRESFCEGGNAGNAQRDSGCRVSFSGFGHNVSPSADPPRIKHIPRSRFTLPFSNGLRVLIRTAAQIPGAAVCGYRLFLL